MTTAETGTWKDFNSFIEHRAYRGADGCSYSADWYRNDATGEIFAFGPSIRHAADCQVCRMPDW